MKKVKIGQSNIEASQIALGCMRLKKLETQKEVDSLIHTAIESGIDFFDHADIYGQGKCEELFGSVVSTSLREKIIIQSKCGIVPGKAYNHSKEYILESVDNILKRLQTDYLDLFLLHRPDTLMDGEEVASAFETLERNGKVRSFGVSNQNTMQIELLNKYCNNKIMVNQLQLSLAHCGIVDAGLNVNMTNDLSNNHDGSVLEYCRLKDITIQSWSPFQSPFGVFIGNENYPELNKELLNLAEKYNVSVNAIAVAWISRHPANIQTIVGTTNEQRIKDICAGSEIVLTREEWYKLYMSVGKKLP